MVAAGEIIGIDHVYLTVRSVDVSERFYDSVLGQLLGFRKSRFALDSQPHVQYYNRQLGIVIRPARGDAGVHDRYVPGLHHLCLRVSEAAEIDRIEAGLRACGIPVEPARLYPDYAPDYYALFVEDPDGIRLEITNFRAERRERLLRWESDAPGGG